MGSRVFAVRRGDIRAFHGFILALDAAGKAQEYVLAGVRMTLVRAVLLRLRCITPNLYCRFRRSRAAPKRGNCN